MAKKCGRQFKNVMGYRSTSARIICEATLPDELDRFYALFDILNKMSAVKSTLPLVA